MENRDLSSSIPCKNRVQFLRLRNCPREPVENEAFRRVLFLESLGNETDHQIIRHEPARSHDWLGLQAQGCLLLHGTAKNVARGDVRDLETLGEPFRLCSLTTSRRPH